MMPDVETASDLASDLAPEDLVEVASYRTYAEGSNHGLVILAMNHPYWLVPAIDRVRLLVAPEIAAAARHQLKCYERESEGWPPQPVRDDFGANSRDVLTPLLWSAIVLAVFRAQYEWPAITSLSALDADAIFRRHEWWRAFTALFVHADASHVISNALSGTLVLFALVTTLGTARAWVLLLVSSVAANFSVAWLQVGQSYVSLGASTAIFAALGLLTGRAIRVAARSEHPHRWRTILVPFAAGLTILSLYGAGGLRIDVGAHLAGFIAGLVLGYAAGIARKRFRTRVDGNAK